MDLLDYMVSRSRTSKMRQEKCRHSEEKALSAFFLCCMHRWPSEMSVPQKSVVLAFKFCPTKSVVLACNEIHLIKVIPCTKKVLHRKTHRANQIFSRYYFSSSNSNAYAFIEDPENQINNTVFNHNW